MRNMRTVLGLLLVVMSSALIVHAQSAKLLEFDVVSIKRNTSGPGGGGGKQNPDGGTTIVNQPMRGVLSLAAPVPVQEVVGAPDWTLSEWYDITTKPPAGATKAQIGEMWRAMFADRMKLRGHVEEKEADAYALVLARSDGRLGPNITPAPSECVPAQPGTSLSPEVTARCGGLFGSGRMEIAAMTMDGLASQLGYGRFVDRFVNNRTGLQGFFSISLKFARMAPTPGAPVAADEPPIIYTALQEQLGLKLVPDKMKVSTFVIDYMERPSEN